jgi:hypothetical protein
MPEQTFRPLKLCNQLQVDKIVLKVAIEFSGKRHFMASIGFEHNSISRALEASSTEREKRSRQQHLHTQGERDKLKIDYRGETLSLVEARKETRSEV